MWTADPRHSYPASYPSPSAIARMRPARLNVSRYSDALGLAPVRRDARSEHLLRGRHNLVVFVNNMDPCDVIGLVAQEAYVPADQRR